ncbi:hypothetical protein [Dawidia soli]|uniref:Uncharacterized protein n=1 Tax=Dawidia soli TaxID=2782352 RepID=A0AAP2D7J7_9BACT|nr:hypothetical protein [Dawidia soli]MBT1686913.1 hypothetical protein [Dawidia soli]
MSKDELIAFVGDEENGVRQSVTIGRTEVNIQYRPTDLWVAQELDGETPRKAQIDSLRKKYDRYYYFILSFSQDKKEALHQVQEGFGQYSELVQVLSFHMPEYVTLTTSAQDTIPVGDFMLNRTYGMSSATEVLFVFSREKATDQEWVQFNLNEFGMGIGNQRFRFKRSDLENVPALAF